MNDKRYVISLDFGTLSGRAILVDTENGDIVATFVEEYAHGIIQDFLPDGVTPIPHDWCLQDPDDYLQVLLNTVHALLRESRANPEQIIALGLDFTACTILPLTKDAVPLCKLPQYRHRPHAYVKLWKHHAAQPEADEINEKLRSFSNDVAVYYGDRISAEILLPKVLQLLREDPALYREMDTISEASDWLNRLLTGRQKRSIDNSGYKAMYFNEHGYPPDEFFHRIDPALKGFISDKLAGSVCRVTEPFGTLTREWAGRLGLREGIAVGCSVIDAHAGMIGCGITRPGQMMLALGTSSVQSLLSHTPYSGRGIIGALRDCVIPGYYLWESGLAAVGDQLAWFADHFRPAGQSEDDYLSTLSRRAAALKPGESGLLALDWWNGNKTPFVSSNLAGVIVGMRLSTTPEDIFRALMESTAFGTKLILDTFEQAGESVREIIACGGIVDKNPQLMQIYADVLGREIRVAGCSQTIALGAAIYASVAAGAEAGGYNTLDDAAAHMTSLKNVVYRPVPEHHEAYRKLFGEYLELSNYFGQKNIVLQQHLFQLKEEAGRTERREGTEA
ncbi:MAG: ribulokinase [Eubacteriales bacterium]|nr:ribulokinase [Eubacteriales bacterium]